MMNIPAQSAKWVRSSMGPIRQKGSVGAPRDHADGHSTPMRTAIGASNAFRTMVWARRHRAGALSESGKAASFAP